MIYISSESLFIKLLTTSKVFLILAWLNINFELLKIGCNQARYVGRGTCLEWLPPPRGDQWHGMASCKSHKCCTVRGR